MEIGDIIKNRRIELNMSQDELAKKVGYKSRSSIQKIESARTLPLKKVSQMAKALDCSPSYLMGWDDPVETFDTSEDFEKHWNAIGGGRHPLHIDDTEYSIIVNYRASDPGTQNAVLKLLDIEKKDADILNA